MSLACSCFIKLLESTHPSIDEGGDPVWRTSYARCNRDRRQSKILPNKPANLDNAMRSRHSCTQPTLQSCVGVAPMAEIVYHNLGRPQEKALVPESTPRAERKTLLNAQAACQCYLLVLLGHCNIMLELFSTIEALMSDLSCTRILVTFGWLHTWGTRNRTQTQGLRRTSELAIGKGCVARDTVYRLIGCSKRSYP